MKKRYIRMSIIILILIIIDQITKQFAINNKSSIIANMEFIQNYGAAFGIGGNSTLFIILVNIVVLGIIVKFIYSQKDRVDTKTLASFTMILAGGIGNLIDRIFRGFVVDFIDISKLFKFPSFNIADIYIVIGWAMLFVSIIIYWYKEVKVINK